MSSQLTPIGSEPKILPGARLSEKGPVLDQRIQVTVVAPSRSTDECRSDAIRTLGSQLPKARHHLSRQAYESAHGASSDHLDGIVAFARDHNLEVTERSPERRCIVLSGTLGAFSESFKVRIVNHEHPAHGVYRTHEGTPHLPSEIASAVEIVLGLEECPVVFPHSAGPWPPFGVHKKSNNFSSPREIARYYQFPERLDGTNQKIALVLLGGGFYESDLDEYFKQQGYKTPTITVKEVGGQENDPSDRAVIEKWWKWLSEEEAAMPADERVPKPDLSKEEWNQLRWTVETTLDIELVGSFANGADITVFFAPNNTQGQYHALSKAIFNRDSDYAVISCSWGSDEFKQSRDTIRSLDRLFQAAALRGVTICFSSGDNGDGSVDRSGEGRDPSVHFPASSPHVLSCGGAMPCKAGVTTGGRTHEQVWNESLANISMQSGGGFSTAFAARSVAWQQPDLRVYIGTESPNLDYLKNKGRDDNLRGVPDVSGKADFESGYLLHIGGRNIHMGGTSSVAPMWAGLVAVMAQGLETKIGFLNPLLYNPAVREALTDIGRGGSGEFFPVNPKGWDPCTGLGTPLGKKLLVELKRESD